jgi:hypothetical protein
MLRRSVIAAVITVVGLCFACGGPNVNESLSKEFTIHSPDKADTVPVERLEGDGEGSAPVDYGGRDELEVLPFSAKYELDKSPRDSSDVEITYARLTVHNPGTENLSSVHSVHVYLLPRGSSWHNSSDWRRVAVGHGFPRDSRTIDFDLLSRPSNVQQFIQREEDGEEVWVAIYVVLDEDVQLPEEGLEVTVDMDLKISI